jgi:hypothetical protein
MNPPTADRETGNPLVVDTTSASVINAVADSGKGADYSIGGEANSLTQSRTAFLEGLLSPKNFIPAVNIVFSCSGLSPWN